MFLFLCCLHHKSCRHSYHPMLCWKKLNVIWAKWLDDLFASTVKSTAHVMSANSFWQIIRFDQILINEAKIRCLIHFIDARIASNRLRKFSHKICLFIPMLFFLERGMCVAGKRYTSNSHANTCRFAENFISKYYKYLEYNNMGFPATTKNHSRMDGMLFWLLFFARFNGMHESNMRNKMGRSFFKPIQLLFSSKTLNHYHLVFQWLKLNFWWDFPLILIHTVDLRQTLNTCNFQQKKRSSFFFLFFLFGCQFWLAFAFALCAEYVILTVETMAAFMAATKEQVGKTKKKKITNL